MTVAFARLDPLAERDIWLRWRRQGIGASDAAGLLNLSRFASPMSIYLDKVGLTVDDEGTEPMRWGRLLEQPIAEEFEYRSGLHVIEQQVCATNADRPWERCTLDGLVAESSTSVLESALGVLEIKNTADFAWDQPPDEYQIQVIWQLGICELEHGWLAALHAGRRLAIYDVPFDPVVFEDLRQTAERFWFENVMAENPPPADGEPATTDALKAAYRTRADGTVRELGADDELLCVALAERKAERKVLDGRIARIENQLRDLLGEATVGARDGVELVSWKPQATAARFDVDALERDHPYLFAAYRGESGTTRVLRLSKATKKKAGIE